MMYVSGKAKAQILMNNEILLNVIFSIEAEDLQLYTISMEMIWYEEYYI
jgi:hypothetical protein